MKFKTEYLYNALFDFDKIDKVTRPNISQLIKINTVRVVNLQPEISQVYHAKLDIVNTSLFLNFKWCHRCYIATKFTTDTPKVLGLVLDKFSRLLITLTANNIT